MSSSEDQAPPAPSAHGHHILFLVSICDGLVLVIYIWLITFGTWTRWLPSETFYDQLATSFRHGSLALEVRPDPALLALPDPYNPAERKDIPHPPNVSLYKGKYYLYFGPAPAALLALLKTLAGTSLSDTALTLLFIFGIFVLSSFFLARIWSSFFPTIPPWSIIPGILALGITTPYPWLLYSAGITEVAIAASQFFFLAGLYVGLQGMAKAPSSSVLFAATGILWALSIGSRLTQLFPVAFASALLVIWSARDSKLETRWRKVISVALPLAAPLVAGLLALALYNEARFGSVLETGLYYQLTSQDLQTNYHDLFSPVYIVQNLYNYFLTLPKLMQRFPFLSPTKGSTHSILGFVALPKIYYSQELAGLIYVSPWIVLAVLPLLSRLGTLRKAAPRLTAQAQHLPVSLDRLSIAFLGSFALGLAPLLFFFWTATRYLLDFVPSLALLGMIGFAQALQRAKEKPFARIPISLLGIGLIVYSIIAGNLVAMSVNSTGFRQLNPLLWKQLINLFRP